MIQAPWQRVYGHQRRALRDHSRLMFVACSESAATGRFIDAFQTAYVVQTLAGASDRVDPAIRSALAYGVLERGVRQIVVYGHGGCRGDGEARAPERSHALVVARCRALRDDAVIGPILREARATLRPLWVDEVSQDIWACLVEGGPAKRLDDDDLAALFTQLDEASA